MKKFLVTLALIIMALTIFWLWNRNSELKKVINNTHGKVDTVRIDKPFKPTLDFQDFQLPKTVFLYRVDSIPVDRVIYKDRIVTIVQKDSTRIEYQDQFLVNYPDKPKFIQLLADKSKLSITTFKTDCTLATEEYQVNFNRYQYNYQDGKLTYKKTPFLKRFNLVPQYTFRPISNMHDLDLGLKYNTSKFNYEVGLNLNYYPSFRSHVGVDPYLRIQYNF